MLRAVEEGYMEVLQLLVKHGADPDQARISDGLTPLICALVMNNLDITKELLKSADVNKVRIYVLQLNPLPALCNTLFFRINFSFRLCSISVRHF